MLVKTHNPLVRWCYQSLFVTNASVQVENFELEKAYSVFQKQPEHICLQILHSEHALHKAFLKNIDSHLQLLR